MNWHLSVVIGIAVLAALHQMIRRIKQIDASMPREWAPPYVDAADARREEENRS